MKLPMSVAAIAAIALAASVAHAAEQKPFGPASEPTIWGHAVEPSSSGAVGRLLEVRRASERPASAEAATPAGRRASEPTIWGHALPDAARGRSPSE